MVKMKAVEITVGMFMIAAIVSLLVLALQVSGLGTAIKKTPGYKVKVEFNNIGSLKPKAKVAIAGVVIGRVDQIHLNSDNFNAEVWLSLNAESQHKLPADTRASILTAGLLGDNYISLSPGFEENAFLKEGDIISIENTDSAVVLEQLISKFLAGQASQRKPESEGTPKVETPSSVLPKS